MKKKSRKRLNYDNLKDTLYLVFHLRYLVYAVISSPSAHAHFLVCVIGTCVVALAGIS